ncbi:hypothetical protein [Neptunicella marina]|uniref:PAS domain-containing protein n=1 Tax=Neptunicella marina TaxID=2125989 RepID=A0A8J6IVH9_9ALTE|nr:hypothetical protein [Neptunicella marina]MBC3766984.1 hypothetical protein [Neptunicella marina]
MYNFSNKASEQKLAIAKEKLTAYEQIFASLKSEMLHVSLDTEGRIISANELFLTEINLNFTTMSGQKFTGLVPDVARKTSQIGLSGHCRM